MLIIDIDLGTKLSARLGKKGYKKIDSRVLCQMATQCERGQPFSKRDIKVTFVPF